MSPLDLIIDLKNYVDPITLIWASALLVVVAMSMNLVIAGKNGWAWPVIRFILSTAGLFLRGIAGMFREVASSHEDSRSWDEE